MFGHCRSDDHFRGRHFGGRGGPRGWERFVERFASPGWDEDREDGARRRRFGGDELRLILLQLISDTPRHGYDLIRAIEERSGGVYAPSPGVVYPTLTMLGEMELIEQQDSEGTRKLFAILPAGKDHLEKHADAVRAAFARLDAIAERSERPGSMPLRRAMKNLRTALAHKMVEGLDRDKLNAMVEAIDETARKIERL